MWVRFVWLLVRLVWVWVKFILTARHLTHYQNHKYKEQILIKGYGSFFRIFSKRDSISNVLVEKKKTH